jgi:putative Holliday junction resolvase
MAGGSSWVALGGAVGEHATTAAARSDDLTIRGIGGSGLNVMEEDKHGQGPPPSLPFVGRDLAAFRAACPQGPLLGVDPGEKRIGLAVCDPTRLIASPLETLHRRKFAEDSAALWAAAEKRGCLGLVLGLPLEMGGREGPAAQSAKAFARNLSRQKALPILLWDERLSTAAVTRVMIEADITRAKRAREVDKLAAAYMLQGAVDALRSLSV